MITSVFGGSSADEAWCKAARRFGPAGGIASQPSRNGPTKELLRSVFEVEDPLARWVCSRSPALNPALAIIEVLAMFGARQDVEFFRFWSKKYEEFNGPGPTYNGSYGYRLRHRFGLDQLERAASALRSVPESRQIVLQIWSGSTDLPNEDGSPRLSDVPCNLLSMVKIRDGRLEWSQILRSNDLFRGVPYNFVQFTILQEVLAGWVGVGIGSYVHWSDSLHVYESDVRHFTNVVQRQASPHLPHIPIDQPTSRSAIAKVIQLADELRSASVGVERVHQIGQLEDLPLPYRDWVRVLASEAARHRGEGERMQEIRDTIADGALRQASVLWTDSIRDRSARASS
jgi:thymidylate synthase